MNFLNSLPLWSALAALGVATPILIHLWSRNQKYQIPWAAMELLKKATIARSQKIKVEKGKITEYRVEMDILFILE